jgi:hypothetical protein
MKLLPILLLGFVLSGCASNPWSPQWGTKERIEQTLNEKLPVGSSREQILAFFQKRNIHVMELAPLAKRPEHTLTVSFPVSWLRVPQSRVSATYHLGPDGKSTRVTLSEGLAGFL